MHEDFRWPFIWGHSCLTSSSSKTKRRIGHCTALLTTLQLVISNCYIINFNFFTLIKSVFWIPGRTLIATTQTFSNRTKCNCLGWHSGASDDCLVHSKRIYVTINNVCNQRTSKAQPITLITSLICYFIFFRY